MKGAKAFWIALTIMFAIFLTLYISQATGYYDYEQYKKTELTKEKIEQFEKDVKSGKDIRIENYVENIDKDYNNNISRMGIKISNTIKNYVKKGVNGTLKFLGLFFSD
jgi:L-ribulose-5-phosphate 3-epimerase UlaE